jgi:hypothetical protein
MDSHEAHSDANLAAPHRMRRTCLVLAALGGLAGCADWHDWSPDPDPVPWETIEEVGETRFPQLIPLPGNRLLLGGVTATFGTGWGMNFTESDLEFTVWDQRDNFEIRPATNAVAQTDDEGNPYFVERHEGGRLAIRGYKGTDLYGPYLRGRTAVGAPPPQVLYVDSTGGLITDFGTLQDPRPSYLPAHLAKCTTPTGERCEYDPDGEEWQPLELPRKGFGIYQKSGNNTVAYTKDGALYLVISSPRGENELARIEPGGAAVSIPVPCGMPTSQSCATPPIVISGGPARDHIEFYVSFFGLGRLYRLKGTTQTLLIEGRGENAVWDGVYRGGNGQLYFDVSEGSRFTDHAIYILDGSSLRRIIDLPWPAQIGVTDDGNLYISPRALLEGGATLSRLVR